MIYNTIVIDMRLYMHVCAFQMLNIFSLVYAYICGYICWYMPFLFWFNYVGWINICYVVCITGYSSVILAVNADLLPLLLRDWNLLGHLHREIDGRLVWWCEVNLYIFKSKTNTFRLLQATNLSTYCCLCCRAGPSLSAYNYDSAYGKRALVKLYKGILEQVTVIIFMIIIFM